ncbi:ABC transporter permease [Patescibacteria group bacterium]|nr:ABC transporter permease [Patescibacteria group bacterium]
MINKIIIKITIIVVVMALWQVAVTVFNTPTYIFPAPTKVFGVLIEYRQIIFISAIITMTEAFLGFFIANLASVTIALLISFYRNLESIIIPPAIVIKTMPIIAIAPLLTLWFGSGIFSKVIAAMLVCFFPALINVLRGVKSLSIELVWLFKIYSANKLQLIKKLILPGILPYLFSAFKTSSSLAVVGALVGEFIGSNRGLGFLIMSNYYNMNIPLVFAAIITSSIFGISFYYVIHFFEKKMVFDREKIQEG